MKPVLMERMQTEGDAYRAAIASLLEIELGMVPAFDGRGQDYALLAWLLNINVARIRIERFDPPPMLWIARLQSPYPGYSVHSVVMDGGVLAHDPHPEQIGFAMDQVIAAEVFAPVDLSRPFGVALLSA